MGKREKSTKPAAIRRRLTKHNKKTDEVVQDIALLYQKPIEEWDFQELMAGRPRGANGKLKTNGARPSWITPILQAEAQKRLKDVSRSHLGMLAGDAIQVMQDLMIGDDVRDNVRLAAAQYVLNQTIGLPKASVEINGALELKAMFADSIVNPDGSEAHPIVIDGEYVVEEDDADDNGE